MQEMQQMPPENSMQQFMQIAGKVKAVDSSKLLSLINLSSKVMNENSGLAPVQIVEYLYDNGATPEDIWGLFRYNNMDNPMVPGMINSVIGVQPKTYTNFDSVKQRATGGIHINPENVGKFTAKANAADMGVQAFANKVLNAEEGVYSPETRRQANFARNASNWNHADGGTIDNPGFNALPEYVQEKILDNMKRGGEMIKRADGSYSQRGFWDNIRAAAERNKAAGRSGEEPTKEMRDMERKLSKKALGGGTCPEGMYWNGVECVPISEMSYGNTTMPPWLQTEFDKVKHETLNNFKTLKTPKEQFIEQLNQRIRSRVSDSLSPDNLENTLKSWRTPYGPQNQEEDSWKGIPYRALGGTSDGCPEGFYYDANTGNCLPIPEEVGGRPASAYNPSSLQGFLERGAAREKTLSDLTSNLNLSQEELKQLELDLKNEYADVERKRKNILVQAERQSGLTKNVRDKLNDNDPAYVKPFNDYMNAETPAQARAAISSMPVDMRDAIVRNGNIGIATQPSARGIMCASGVCDVALNAGYNIPFMPGNVTFINYAKNNPQWEIVDQNNAQPGDIYSATGWAPADYRSENYQEVLRGHDLGIVADQSSNKALIEKWRNDAIKYDYEDQIRGAKPIVLYGNQGADFGFKPFVRAMFPKSQVLALQGKDRGTKDYGTVMRYIGDTGILKDQIANQNTLINTLQSNLEDADLNMIAGLPTLRAQPIEIDLPERELMVMQQLPEEEKRRRLLGMNRYRLRRPVKFT